MDSSKFLLNALHFLGVLLVALSFGTSSADPMPGCSVVAPSQNKLREEYEKGSELLAEARRLMEQSKWKDATITLECGIELVGSDYYNGDTLDDTGMHILPAEQAAKRGEYVQAANGLTAALEDRLSQLKRKIR